MPVIIQKEKSIFQIGVKFRWIFPPSHQILNINLKDLVIFKNKKAVSMVGDLLVKIVIGILILVFVVGGLYVILTKDLFGIANMLKNIFRFR